MTKGVKEKQKRVMPQKSKGVDVQERGSRVIISFKCTHNAWGTELENGARKWLRHSACPWKPYRVIPVSVLYLRSFGSEVFIFLPRTLLKSGVLAQIPVCMALYPSCELLLLLTKHCCGAWLLTAKNCLHSFFYLIGRSVVSRCLLLSG